MPPRFFRLHNSREKHIFCWPSCPGCHGDDLLRRPLIKGANQMRLQRCLNRLVQIQTQKSKQGQAHGSGVGSIKDATEPYETHTQYCIMYIESKDTLETGWSMRGGGFTVDRCLCGVDADKRSNQVLTLIRCKVCFGCIC